VTCTRDCDLMCWKHRVLRVHVLGIIRGTRARQAAAQAQARTKAHSGAPGRSRRSAALRARTLCSAGSRYASVLPLPVSAASTALSPRRMGGMAST
jgi:hypothetical protein